MPFGFVCGLRLCVVFDVFGFDTSFDLDAAGFAAFRFEPVFVAVGDLVAELFFAGALAVDFAATGLDFTFDFFAVPALAVGDFVFVGIVQVPPKSLCLKFTSSLSATDVPSETRVNSIRYPGRQAVCRCARAGFCRIPVSTDGLARA